MGIQRDIMKIRGKLAQILVEIAPEVFGHYNTQKKGKTSVIPEIIKSIIWYVNCIIIILTKVEK